MRVKAPAQLRNKHHLDVRDHVASISNPETQFVPRKGVFVIIEFSSNNLVNKNKLKLFSGRGETFLLETHF
jgi:hypothetical protein